MSKLEIALEPVIFALLIGKGAGFHGATRKH